MMAFLPYAYLPACSPLIEQEVPLLQESQTPFYIWHTSIFRDKVELVFLSSWSLVDRHCLCFLEVKYS
jgi:hypothetical protein